MSNLHLVTGYAGQAHVTAADDGYFNTAIFGSGQYVLDLGSKFAASVVSNNKITIADGDLLMQGRHVRLNEGTTVDLTINNGAQGKLRNDLIVARYTKDSISGVEEVNLVVIQGTAVDSNPVDPEYTSGDIINDHVLLNDMPLYRVPLDGLTVGTPVALFSLATIQISDGTVTTAKLASGLVVPIGKGGTGNTTGLAQAAKKLETARFFQTNLSDPNGCWFDGAANAAPGIAGVLPIGNGGTGNTTGLAQAAKKLETARNLKVNLAAEWDCYFDGSDPNTHQIGVMNALPVSHGGTGATTAANAVSTFFPSSFSTPGYVCSMGSSGYSGGGGYTTLAQLKTALGTVSIKKLWTNASPNSDFAAQTISLSLSSYQLVLVVFKNTGGSSILLDSICPVGQIGGFSIYWGDTGASRTREYTVKTTGITFETGYADGSASNYYAIPYLIYGIMGVT